MVTTIVMIIQMTLFCCFVVIIYLANCHTFIFCIPWLWSHSCLPKVKKLEKKHM